MNDRTDNEQKIDFQAGVNEILSMVDQDREREIIVRRFGLFDRRETLEQIGELLGITRERVRQLEKSILNKLKSNTQAGKIPIVNVLEKHLIRRLIDMGRVARVSELTDQIYGGKSNQKQRSQITFIAELADNLTVINENDNYHQAIGIMEYGDEKKIRTEVDSIVAAIRKHGQPITIEELHEMLPFDHPDFIKALASISKLLANLKDNWGLVKWPAVNPKNIRDKIFVVLAEFGSPMHFTDIAKKIKVSSFKRKDVTTQAIHNELIKDSRFVLIGRGIYALDSWGFNQGTVADIIAGILEKANTPLHRDEIVKQVLKSRQVKETTILLNLQSKPQFKRVAKATYALKTVEN